MSIKKKTLVAGAMALCVLPASGLPTRAMAWTKSFVAEWFEPAFYYGGPKDAGSEAPGSDCPNGINEIDWHKELLAPYRTKADVAEILSPEHSLGEKLTSEGFRGPHAENIYENPTVVADPGIVLVTGKIAEGFDLDDDPNTGFTSPDGVKGIDNAFYKVSGCVRRWRGSPRTSSTNNFHNDGMRNGFYTVLFVFSGSGADPMNDEHITVGAYTSADAMVKDAGSLIAPDYTYRVNPDPAFQTVFSARSHDGVVESTQPMTFRSHDHMQGTEDRPWLVLEKAKARFVFKPDGKAEGLVGGYRDWFEAWRNPMGNGGAHQGAGNGVIQGSTAEGVGHFNAIGWYYALRREADGLKDPKTGQNTGISSAYRYYLLPAFVVSPQGDKQVQVAEVFTR